MSANGQKRESVQKPLDRRVSRTRRNIDDAFVALLQRTDYDAIGVSDIVRTANVGRATFYGHYTSKDDLLRSQLRRVTASLLRACPDEPWLFDATPLFAHVKAVPALYRTVAGGGNGGRSARLLQDAIEERAVEILRERLAAGAKLPAPMTPSVAARITGASLFALLA